MRKLLFSTLILLLLLGLPCGGAFATQSREEVAAAVDELAGDYRINILYDYKPKATWDIGGKPADEGDTEDLAAFVKLLDEEFRKYPKKFVHNTHLGLIVLVKGLVVAGQARAAMPDYYRQTLWLDFKEYRKFGDYQRRIIHHEFYHLIDFELSQRAYWQDPQWMALNQPATFKYGEGGARAYTDHNFSWSHEAHPAPGFVNRYATTGVEEDKAEIFAWLFMPSQATQMAEWIKTDSALRAKTEFMKNIVRGIDADMHETYWSKLRAQGAQATTTLPPQAASK